MAAPSLEELNEIAGPLLSANKSLNLGPFIVGLILDTLLLGVLLMQCGAYVTLGKADRPYLKGIVAYVLLMNITISVYTWTWIYDLFVYNFGTYGLFVSVKYISQYYVLDSMTVIVVQAFFAIRAWKVANRNWLVLGLITTFALTAFGGGVGVKVIFMQVGSTLRAGDVKIPAYIWLFSTVAADLIITCVILFYLFTSRKTTGQKATDDVITRLARVTFESQLPPTLIAIGLATEYTIQYSSFIAIPFLCVQAKFYGISLMHTLNSREVLKNVGSTMTADDGDIEFAKRSQNTFWLSSRFTSAGDGTRATKGDTHRHTQFTIMPEPRTRRVKAESIDTVSFKGVDLGDDDESRTSRSRDREAGVRKTSEIDLGENGISVVDLDDVDAPRRPGRGSEFKLASMGLGGGMSSSR
ncbi:putative transmembrane protein [Rhizoctonia solani 123E]|uniref:Putative transmembrane protein n=1 Tax=Rhizoctonia solani 123E TaxID=1423351 RepID=A0A074S4Z4_9AGAM|nr:putative transmembrane protein [Rhizoctonia solani 123E]